MKIVRPDFQGAIRQSSQACRFHMNHVVLILQRSFDEQKSAARHHQPVALVKIGRDDHVGDARLIFHRDEDETFCRTRPLPRDDAAGHADILPIPAQAKSCADRILLRRNSARR